MMSLYVSSHYKNSPNDLQLMSDAPAHRLFVLLGPVDPSAGTELPDVLCVIQVRGVVADSPDSQVFAAAHHGHMCHLLCGAGVTGGPHQQGHRDGADAPWAVVAR